MSVKTLYDDLNAPENIGDEWETPRSLFKRLNKEFNFDLDACATEQNAKCERYFTKEQNALRQDWIAEAVFCNPPYSLVGDFVEKAYYAWKTGDAKIVVLLTFSKTETKWFQKYVLPHAEIRFIKGRLFFEYQGRRLKDRGQAPFGSMITIWSDNRKVMKNLKAYFQENEKNESA